MAASGESNFPRQFMLKAALEEQYEVFLSVLRDTRRRQGLTQVTVSERLGEELGISQSDVSKIERGERRLDVVEFIILAEVLGVPPQEILKEFDSLTRKKKKSRRK